MDLSAETAQLAMLRGQSLNRTPNAGVFNYKSPWGMGTLYVFADSRGPSSEYACRLVIETIGSEFKASNRSLTASLTSAIKAAHIVLLAENRRSLRDHQASVGITCAVTREGQLFVAQSGPAVAYALLGGQVTRIPSASSRALPSWSTPVGGGDSIEVSLSRYSVHASDVVLMASAVLATKPVEAVLPELLALGLTDLLSQLEHYLHDEPVFSALVIGFEEASKRGAQSISRAAKEPSPKGGRTVTETILPALGAVAAALSRIRLPSLNRKKAGDALRTFFPDNGNGASLAGKPYRANGKRHAPVSVLAREDQEQPSLATAHEEEKPSMVWSKKLGTIEDRTKAAASRPKRSLVRNLRLPLFLIMLLLGVLLVCSLAANFSRFTDSQAEATFDRTLNSAAITRERAMSADDLARSRSLLNDADHLVDEALSIKNTDPKARALKQRIEADLAKMNAVVKLPEAKVLTDLAKVEGGTKNLTNLVVEGEDAFILDRGSSRVYQFGIDLKSSTLKVGMSSLLAKKGDKIGETTVSDLVSILWMGGGSGTARQSSNLLIFDSARNLFEFTPGKGLAQLKVRGAQAWLNPAVALGYSSNLYILDPSASQVWRYFPTFNGYDSEMRGLLENADIKDAVDFAIDRDIFALTRGGKVLKFVGGRLESFDQDQLDKGLANPTTIFTTPKTKFVYVLDAGNNRIVVFTKEGKFQRQLVGEALDESPKSIYVDEEKGKIYIIADKKLYLSTLPK